MWITLCRRSGLIVSAHSQMKDSFFMTFFSIQVLNKWFAFLGLLVLKTSCTSKRILSYHMWVNPLNSAVTFIIQPSHLGMQCMQNDRLFFILQFSSVGKFLPNQQSTKADCCKWQDKLSLSSWSELSVIWLGFNFIPPVYLSFSITRSMTLLWTRLVVKVAHCLVLMSMKM